MKTVFSFLTAFLLLFVSATSFAQAKKQTLKVAGECGMCRKKIEGAAKKAGASYASWNVDSKLLTLRYDASRTNTQKIEAAIAAAGYDTPDVRATDDAYGKLDACCQYARGEAKAASCCDSAKCKETACMKDGKCAPDQQCCKDSGCASKDCCKH